MGIVNVTDSKISSTFAGEFPSGEELATIEDEDISKLMLMMAVAAVPIGLLTDGEYSVTLEFLDDVSYYEERYHRELPNGQKQIALPPGGSFSAKSKLDVIKENEPFPCFDGGLTRFLIRAKDGKSEEFSKVFEYFRLIGAEMEV